MSARSGQFSVVLLLAVVCGLSVMSGCKKEAPSDSQANTVQEQPPSPAPSPSPSPTPTPTPSPTPTPISVVASLPSVYPTPVPTTVATTIYVGSHDTAARTISFAHNADSISCSHDGGASWGACDSANSVVYSIADYDAARTVQVKFTKTGVSDEIYSITPSTDFPDLDFLSCTTTVAADGEIADFITNYAAAAAPDSVICLNAGVVLTQANPTDGGTPSIVVNASGVKVVGTIADSATISMNPGSAYTLLDVRAAGVELINLKLDDMWTSQAGAKYIVVGAAPASITLRNVTISGASLNGYAVYSVSGGSVSVIGSTIKDVSGQIKFYGVYASGGGTVSIQDSSFADGISHVILLEGATGVIAGSKFYAPNNYFILVSASSSSANKTTTLSLTESSFDVKTIAVGLSTYAQASARVVATIDDNSFRGHSTATLPIWARNDTLGGEITLNSTGGDSNNYCDYNDTFWCALGYLSHSNISIGIGELNCAAGTGAGAFNTDKLNRASIGSCGM